MVGYCGCWDWLARSRGMLGITHAIEILFENAKKQSDNETVLFILDSKHLQVSVKHDDDLTWIISSVLCVVLLHVELTNK